MTKAQQTLQKVTAPEYQLLSPGSKAFLKALADTGNACFMANELETMAQVGAMLLADYYMFTDKAEAIACNLSELTHFRQNYIGSSMTLP